MRREPNISRTTPNSSSGFTIIELMIGITLTAVLLGLAAPPLTQMLANEKVRASAEAMVTAVQTARAEAIKRNGTVVFALVDNDPSTIRAVGPTYSAANQGAHWAVFSETAAGAGFTYELIDSRINLEGGRGAAQTSTATYLASATRSAPGRIAFNSLGAASELAGVATIDIRGTNGSGCEHETGSLRCLRIAVSPGGGVKMCDPKVTTAGDSRRCPS